MLTIAAPSLPLGVEIYSRQQVRGHNVANLDPLGILDADLSNEIPYEIQYQYVRCPFCISACLSLCVWMYGCTRAYQCVRVCVCVCVLYVFVCMWRPRISACVCVRVCMCLAVCVLPPTDPPCVCDSLSMHSIMRSNAASCRLLTFWESESRGGEAVM